MAETGRTIIWDFEGTLAVRPGRFTGALVKAVRLLDPKLAMSEDEIRPHLGGGFPWHQRELRHDFAGRPDRWWDNLQSVSASALKTLGLSDELAAKAAVLARSVYLDTRQWTCMEGATQTLDVLSSRGWRHVVMSNFAPELDGIITALGLANRISKTFSSGQVGLEKPNRAYFEHVLDSIAPEKAIFMIGDNPKADIAGGRNAGLKTILVGGVDPTADFNVPKLLDILTLPDLSSDIDHGTLITKENQRHASI